MASGNSSESSSSPPPVLRRRVNPNFLDIDEAKVVKSDTDIYASNETLECCLRWLQEDQQTLKSGHDSMHQSSDYTYQTTDISTNQSVDLDWSSMDYSSSVADFSFDTIHSYQGQQSPHYWQVANSRGQAQGQTNLWNPAFYASSHYQSHNNQNLAGASSFDLDQHLESMTRHHAVNVNGNPSNNVVEDQLDRLSLEMPMEDDSNRLEKKKKKKKEAMSANVFSFCHL